MTLDPDQIVTANEGAPLIGRSRRTIFLWARRALIDPVDTEPLRFRLGDLMELSEQRAQTTGDRLRRGL